MANLPTAYASQYFGRKTLDFYAVEGDVVGADPRARKDERRLQDFDGARHTVRLMDSGFKLEPGHTATVLRMQPGPARRSRPVAVVNHDEGSWTRTHPGADGLLARAGVARGLNWFATMTLFALAALALIWPFMHSFLVELDPALFGTLPAFNLAEMAVAALPALASWSLSDVLAPLTIPLAEAAPALAPSATALVFAGGVLIASLGVYLLRSWRLLWAPLFVVALGAVSIGYAGVAGMVEPALSGLGIAAVLFVLGGMVNRIRDGARLEARIAVLCDHLLSQGPQDAVTPTESYAETAGADDTPVEAEDQPEAQEPSGPIAAAATVASLRQPQDQDDAVHAGTEPDHEDASVEAANDAQVPEAAEAATNNADEDTADADAAAVIEGGVDDASAEPAEAVADEAGAIPAELDEAVEVSEPDEAVDAVAAPEAVVDTDAEPVRADLAVDTTPAGLDPVEAERLRSDPRYASRAIVLPPPPPMPEPVVPAGEGSGEAVGPSETRTLQPDAPLPDNVIPIFAPPASERAQSQDDAVSEDEDGPREPA
jgi:hypothetical protein